MSQSRAAHVLFRVPKSAEESPRTTRVVPRLHATSDHRVARSSPSGCKTSPRANRRAILSVHQSSKPLRDLP
jgi:hypothetical protein